MIWQTLQSEATARHLKLLGGFHPTAGDDVPEACKTLILLGPNEPAFWPAFTQSPEYRDAQSDAMDRWSTRVISDWAEALKATALFPFGGAPFLPFFTWATRTGRIHASPINFLVHDSAGLFVSFRGALALPQHVDLPTQPPKPCDTCAKRPCLSACPVSALTPQGYDVPRCKAYLDTPAGAECMQHGCAARRACPVSQKFGRVPAQSAYHMRHFKGA
jgi:hypothetical protein